MFGCCGSVNSAALGRADDEPANQKTVDRSRDQDKPLILLPTPGPCAEDRNPGFEHIDFAEWLKEHVYSADVSKDAALDRDVGVWTEIRLFMSSTFIDTHAERDIIVKNVIPEVNRKMAPNFIRIIPVDLRWGVLAEEAKSCFDIQKTCLNQVDNCRLDPKQTPWFLALRTERYGWVQSDMMPSKGFEKPAYFDWLDQFQVVDKKVSITSLEVCHATRSPEKLPPYPTIFCYKRHFSENGRKELDKEKLRWVFDFEYTAQEITDPDFKHQYSYSNMSDKYADDREKLDQFLRDTPHVIFDEYTADYTGGGAYYTCKRDNAKSFGVGYTTGLDGFADKVEQDLLTAIRMNFISQESHNLDKFLFESIQHENAIKLKASTFVGRTAMLERALNHCTAQDDLSTMILHGTPGCGKSGLLAAVANKLISRRDNNDFVFIHAVDSCPGSSILERFLRRLNFCLRAFRRKQGEIKLSVDPPEALSDLKMEHHTFIRETGEKYPGSQVIIIVDAVNQFHEAMRSWDMWWLLAECPGNVRVLLSTLNKENGTFTAAKEVCPGAACVEVVHMDHPDRQDMVSKTLERYNKKLTRSDDALLGNQMEMLLAKSASPLYLIAACEALRKFGIFEKVSEYIKLLPDTISELFSFLLDEWSVEYGKLFVEDVAGLLCLSKDGLLENEINDLLRFKEEREKGTKGGFLYEASFARIYDSICSFLAAGGGGYLRFFHDQLKYTVRSKFLNEEFTLRTHQWMEAFFQSLIQPQLVEEPAGEPPDYYEHALQQLFHHQLAAAQTTGQASQAYQNSSLRNIYFVRERITHNQQNQLNEEYILAIAAASGSDVSALKSWAKFVQLYAGYISEFPQFCYNMARNQAPSSDVRKDTLSLPAPASHPGYPLTWVNIPLVDDPMAVKYSTAGVDCVASAPKYDIVAVASASNALILDQSSGELLHKLGVSAYSVYLSDTASTLYVGDNEGQVHSFDVSSGTLKGTASTVLGKPITWVGSTGAGYLTAGTGWGRKAICWDDNEDPCKMMTVDINTLELVHRWECTEPAWHYTYNTATDLLVSTHKGMIKGWNYLDGTAVFSAGENGGCVYSVSSHPTANRLLTGNNNLQVVEWELGEPGVCKRLRTIQLPTISGWAYGGIWSVSYDHDGTHVLCTDPQTKSIMIYNGASERIGEIKGHSDCINIISRIPDTTQILSADRSKATILWNPAEANIDACKQAIDENVLWVGYNQDETRFATTTDTVLRIWDSATQTVLCSAEFSGFYNTCGAFHPDGQHVLVTTDMNVLVFGIQNLHLLATYPVLQDEDGSMSAMAMAPDGSRFMSVECRNHSSELSVAFVWNCQNVLEASHSFTKTGYKARMFSCAISDDASKGLIGGHGGTIMIDMVKGDTLCEIRKGCFFVSFIPSSTDLLLADGDTLYRYTLQGENTLSYSGHSDTVKGAVFANDDQHLVTVADDGVLRVFEVESGACRYAFCNHRAEQFKGVAVKRNNSLVLAPNSNGMLYILAP